MSGLPLLGQAPTPDLGKTVDKAVPDGLGLEDWLQAGITVAVAIFLAVLAHRLVVRLDRRSASDSRMVQVLARITSSAIVFAGIAIALNALEINLGPLVAGLGIAGIVIALAVQDIVANYFAGLLIGIRRPFRLGEEISSQGHEGTVEDLNFRYTTIRAHDNTRVLLPNAGVFGNPLTNFTVNGFRRTTLSIGVAYEADHKRAKQVLCEAAASCAGVRDDPRPRAWIAALGDSALEFNLIFWHEPRMSDVWRVRDSVASSVLEACEAAGIVLPYPRRIVSVEPDPAKPD